MISIRRKKLIIYAGIMGVLISMGGCKKKEESTTSSGNGSTPAVKRIFVTSLTFSVSNLGGISGADTKCAQAAAAGNLGGTWKAWLSDSSTNAIDRITDVGPWYLVDKTSKVFNNKANLASLPLVGISKTELGSSPVFDQYNPFVWTGTLLGGTKSSHTCSNWTSSVHDVFNGPFGAVGRGDTTSGSWTDVSSGGLCDNSNRLYCTEQ